MPTLPDPATAAASAATTTRGPGPRSRAKTWGVVAFACAAVALLGSLLGPSIADRFAPPVEHRVADTVGRVRDAVVTKLKDPNAKVSVASAPSLHARIATWSLALAALGLISAGISYVRREDHRLAVTAGGIALVGIAWQALMVAVGALVLIVIVWAVLTFLATLGGT